MTSLRVERHPRGHIASCNGRVELLNTKVVSCTDPSGNAAENALMMDVWARRENERKTQELESFQRRVKHRVSQREREKQREMAHKSTELVQSEQRVAEKAVKLDKIKVQKSIEVGHDVEDVKVIASAKASHIPQQPGKPTASQIARKNLLMKKGSEGTTDEPRTQESITVSDSSTPHQDRGYYLAVNQSSSVPISEVKSHVGKATTTSSLERRSNLNFGESESNILKQTTSTLHKFTAPGQLEHAQKKQAAQQYHLFRKLYSDLERVQARQKQLQLTHNQRVEKLKQRKEASRRVAEDEVNCMDSCSVISTEAAEDQQRAMQWAELVARETRRQQIQKNQEMDRYIQALRVRLKEQVESRKLDVPPLCACGVSLWDASPDTCANNCSFYKNHKDIQFYVFMHSATDLSKDQIYRVFDMLDVDNSGLLDFDEFYLLVCILLAVRDKQEKEFIFRHSRTVFELLDEDGSNDISAEEFESFGFLFNFQGSAVRQIFREFDVSGDQELDYKEFKMFAMACIDRQMEIEERKKRQSERGRQSGEEDREEGNGWCAIQ